MLVVMVVTFYTSRVILQVLGASDYGIYNVVGGIVTMMGFLNGALGSSSSRFLTYELGKGNRQRLNCTFSASLNLHICVALLVLILGETIGLWFFYEKLVIPEDRMMAAFWIYQFSIITTMINFTQVPFNATLIAHENMSIYAYVGLYEAFSRLAIVYLITISPIDKLVFYALLLMLNQAGIQFFYRFYTTKRYEECKFRFIRDKQLYKTLMGYSGWDLFGGVAVVCQGQGINILLNIFFGPVVNAARAIAVQIQTAINNLVMNLLTASRPQVVKNFAEGNYNEMYALTFKITRYAYYLILPVAIPIIFNSKYLLDLWLGDTYPSETPAFVIIVIITCLFNTVYSAQQMAFHAIGRIKTGNIYGGTLMIISLPLSYLILLFGAPAYAVFIVLLVCNIGVHFIGLYLIHRYVPFNIKNMLKTTYCPILFITFITLLPPVVFHNILENGWVRFATSILITEIIAFVSIWKIGISNVEREAVVNFVKNKIVK